MPSLSSDPPNVLQSSHPLILHKITQMRKARAGPFSPSALALRAIAPPPRVQAKAGPKYLNQLLREVSTFLCYEATADLEMEPCAVTSRLGEEKVSRRAAPAATAASRESYPAGVLPCFLRVRGATARRAHPLPPLPQGQRLANRVAIVPVMRGGHGSRRCVRHKRGDKDG